MSWDTVITRRATPWAGGAWSSRGGASVKYFIVHHAASGSLNQVLDMMQSQSRDVSSTIVVRDHDIVEVVPPQHRPHTSGAPSWDAQAITVETINSAVGDASGWPISEASYASLAKVAAWMADTYPGFELNRNHIIGHRELWTRFKVSYATACPGGIDIDKIIRMAEAIRRGGGFLMSLSPAEQREVLEILRAQRSQQVHIDRNLTPAISRLDQLGWSITQFMGRVDGAIQKILGALKIK